MGNRTTDKPWSQHDVTLPWSCLEIARTNPHVTFIISLLSTRAIDMTFSAAGEKASPLVGQAGGRRAVATVAVGQLRGTVAATQQQTLLALGAQLQRLLAVGCAVRHLGRMPATTQAMSLTGFDQADFGEDM